MPLLDVLISVGVVGGFFLIIYAGFRKVSIGEAFDEIKEFILNLFVGKEEIEGNIEKIGEVRRK